MYPVMYFLSLVKLYYSNCLHNFLKIFKIFLINLNLNEFNLYNFFYQEFVSFAVGPTIISDFRPVLPTPALLGQGKRRAQ